MTLIQTKVNNKVAVITYNNPPLNVLTLENLILIEDAIKDADENLEVSVIVFTMALQKKVFCGGMDLDEMLETRNEPNGIRNYCDVSKQNYKTFYNAKKPTIYAYDGIVRGGGLEMSLFADFRIAGENLNIALPEISLGIIPGGGGTQTLARIIGETTAKEMIFTGKAIKAEEAEHIGLVSKVYPSENLREEVLEYATQMAKHSPLALQAAKKAIKEGIDLPLTEGLKLETNVFVDNFEQGDAKEGITAFREKRKPVYKHRYTFKTTRSSKK